MKKVSFAIDMLAQLRREQSPPLGRYVILLALAEAEVPLTLKEIRRREGNETDGNSTLQTAMGLGLVELIHPAPRGPQPRRRGSGEFVATNRYQLTDAGRREVRRLLTTTGKGVPA